MREMTVKIHHPECGCTDDFIRIQIPEGMEKERVFQHFKKALKETEKEADGDRFEWIDLAIYHILTELGVKAHYGPEFDFEIDLCWGMFGSEESQQKENGGGGMK